MALYLEPGTSRYSFQQHTTIQDLAAPDSAIPGTVRTTAIIQVRISADSIMASTFSITVDSLQIESEGPIPSRRALSRSLGTIMQGTINDRQIVMATSLPDSLCAYSQFISAASQLILPQLPTKLEIPLQQPHVDTTTVTSCRAGIPIEIRATRRLQSIPTAILTISIEEVAELSGTGILRRDSITVHGQITTRGQIILGANSRLPTLVRSESSATLVVQLADSTTRFSQLTTQEVRQQEQ